MRRALAFLAATGILAAAATDASGGEFRGLKLGHTEVFKEPWYHAAAGDVRRTGVARLKPGKYALNLWAIVEGSELRLLRQGPGIEKAPIPAEALSH